MVGLRAGLDTQATGKILCLCRKSNPDRPVCCQTLYWLSYPPPPPQWSSEKRLFGGRHWVWLRPLACGNTPHHSAVCVHLCEELFHCSNTLESQWLLSWHELNETVRDCNGGEESNRGNSGSGIQWGGMGIYLPLDLSLPYTLVPPPGLPTKSLPHITPFFGNTYVLSGERLYGANYAYILTPHSSFFPTRL
jgi:hypothetical protein